MKNRRLLVLANQLSVSEREAATELSSLLGSLVSGVTVATVSTGTNARLDVLEGMAELNRLVNSVESHGLYVGISPRGSKESGIAAGLGYGRIGAGLDAYLIAQRGYQRAIENDIPAVLFDRLNYLFIRSFVKGIR